MYSIGNVTVFFFSNTPVSASLQLTLKATVQVCACWCNNWLWNRWTITHVCSCFFLPLVIRWTHIIISWAMSIASVIASVSTSSPSTRLGNRTLINTYLLMTIGTLMGNILGTISTKWNATTTKTRQYTTVQKCCVSNTVIKLGRNGCSTMWTAHCYRELFKNYGLGKSNRLLDHC